MQQLQVDNSCWNLPYGRRRTTIHTYDSKIVNYTPISQLSAINPTFQIPTDLEADKVTPMKLRIMLYYTAPTSTGCYLRLFLVRLKIDYTGQLPIDLMDDFCPNGEPDKNKCTTIWATIIYVPGTNEPAQPRAIIVKDLRVRPLPIQQEQGINRFYLLQYCSNADDYPTVNGTIKTWFSV